MPDTPQAPSLEAMYPPGQVSVSALGGSSLPMEAMYPPADAPLTTVIIPMDVYLPVSAVLLAMPPLAEPMYLPSVAVLTSIPPVLETLFPQAVFDLAATVPWPVGIHCECPEEEEQQVADLVHFEWNSGPGSLMVIQSYFRSTPSQQSTIALVKSVVKPGDTPCNFRYTLIKNFEHEKEVGVFATVPTPTTQVARTFKPNVRGVDEVAVKIEGFGEEIGDPIDGDAAVNWVELYGEWSEVP